VDAATAATVAAQLMAKDALGAHARDELDITLGTRARPVQAAFASAASFTAGAALPLLTVFIVPPAVLVWAVAGGSLLFLALLGAVGAKTGGAIVWRGMVRVTFWGAFAMAATAAIGRLIGGAV